jgi:hypothetical protein
VLGSNLLLATRTGSGAEPLVSSQSTPAERSSNQADVGVDGKPLASTSPDDPSPSSVAPAPANPAPKKTAKKTQRQQRANNTVRPQPFFWPFLWGQRY